MTKTIFSLDEIKEKLAPIATEYGDRKSTRLNSSHA